MSTTLIRVAPRASSITSASLRAANFSTTRGSRLARITIIGHLADSPELQATSTGHEILRYAVASNHGPRDNRQTSWWRVTSFEAEGPRRDFLRNVPKGTLVCVEGDASMSQYEDAEGKTKSALNIVQRHIEVLTRPQHHVEEQRAAAESTDRGLRP